MASHQEETTRSEKEEFIAFMRRRKMLELQKRRIFDTMGESGSIKKARRGTSAESQKVGRQKSLRMENGYIVISSDDDSQDNTNRKSEQSRRRQSKAEDSRSTSGKVAVSKRRTTSAEDLQKEHGETRRSQERAGGSGVQEAGPGPEDTASIFIKRLSFRHQLGQGTFGKVLLAEDSLTGQQLAVRILRKKDLPLEDREEVLVEHRVLEVASGSAFLIHAHLAFQTPNHLFLGLEYASGGDLHQFLQRRGSLDIASATFYAAEITCGVQYLHRKGIIHRDLKPENILMVESGHLRITDFGLAIDNIFGDQTATEYAGTPGYTAPEMLAGKPYNAGVDWYSFGIVIIEMITGTRQYHPRRFPKAGADAKDIVRQLLCKDPSRRLGVNGNIRQHRLFQHLDWVSLEALGVPPPHVPDPPTIPSISRGFNIKRMEAAVARKTPATVIDQELFRGFSYVGSTLRTIR